MATCTEALAEFALAQTLESLPPSVLEKTKLMILDGVGLALAAAREDFALKTIKALRILGQGADATVIGAEEGGTVAQYPCINCVLSQKTTGSELPPHKSVGTDGVQVRRSFCLSA